MKRTVMKLFALLRWPSLEETTTWLCRLAALLFLVVVVRTQTPTPNFAFNDAVTYPTQATGIDSIDCNYYNLISEKNLIACNDPSWLAQEDHSVEQVWSGTTTTFTSSYSYGTQAANFTVGFLFRVAAHGATATSYTGGAQGCAGTITAQTAPYRVAGTLTLNSNVITGVSVFTGIAVGQGIQAAASGTNINLYAPNGTTITAVNTGAGTVTLSANVTGNGAATAGLIFSGPTYTLSPTPCAAAINATDTIFIDSPASRTATIAELSGNWQFSGNGTAQVDTTPSLLPPAVLGLPQPPQYLQMTVPAGGSETATTFIDNQYQALCNNLLLGGGYLQGVKASLQSGSGVSITMNSVRTSTNTVGIVSGSVALSGAAWSPYSVSGTASVTELPANACVASGVGGVWVQFTVNNGGATPANVGLIGGYLNELSDTNASTFRDAFIGKAIYESVGEFRWNPTNICSLNALVTIPDYRPPCYALLNSIGQAEQGTGAGLYERAQACVAAHVQRCTIVIPTTWPLSDYQNLSDFFFGSTSTTYGGIRAARGQPLPWSFTTFTFEFGNETWNGGFAGVSYTPIQNYIPLATNACLAMKSAASWNPAVGSFAASIQQVQATTFNSLFTAYDTTGCVDSYTSSDYSLMGALSSCTQPTLFNYEVGEQWLNVTLAGNDIHDILAATGPKIKQYENGEAPYGASPCTQAQMNYWIATEGTGLVETLAPALQMSAFPGRVLSRNRWVMTQDFFQVGSTSGYLTANIWGDWRQLDGPAQNPRPQAVGISAVNPCYALGTGLGVTATNVPTNSLAAGNNLPAVSNYPLMVARKYGSGTNQCVIVWNLDATASHSFTWSGTNTPTGTVTKLLYHSANVSDNNEAYNAAPNVALVSSLLATPGGDTLPSNSFGVYMYSTAPASVLSVTHQTYGSPAKRNVTVY